MNPRTLSVLLALGVASSLSSTTLALDEPAPAKSGEKQEAKLVAGMPAPEFKVEKFVKGTPFTSFEKGKLYVVEFWATWCGPCIMSMPHLSELQREYASKNLTIVGVNVREEKDYSAATFDKVSAFVNKRGDRMGYSVAYDGEAKFMESNWMQAANARGIPTAFLVDNTGTIAWIGHPAYLDMVLDEVSKGTWDIGTGNERLDKATSMFEDAGKKYANSMDAGETAWASASKAFPVLAKRMGVDRVSAMMEADRFDEAATAGTQIVDSALKSKSHGEVLELLQTLADPDMLKQKSLRVLLLKAAQANLELGDASEPGPHVALARAYYLNNATEKAKAEREQAMKLSPEARRAGLEKYLSDAEKQAKNN